VAGGESILETC